MSKQKTAITPTRDDDFPTWYQEVIKAADLAENSPVRGSMIIKPYGWAIWENMQAVFDPWLKDHGVQNAAFPLLIPVSFLAKEAEHVDGFATECAVVTHHRLQADAENGMVPTGELKEPYVVRPTSETIIGDAMSRWIQSYRDLPLQLCQWGNVMRWEMRTRMFLRTSEFFWHEGHNAFEDHEGAKNDCLTVLDLYEKFFVEYLALDGFKGIKTPEERFPGANETYAFEAIMQDGKALQAATTHDLGTNFAKSLDIKYQGRDGAEHLAHTTSWAYSSRMIGGLIMMHGDDDGMVMPPFIAPHQVVIMPITKEETQAKVMECCEKLKNDLKAAGLKVKLDTREMRNPDKMWDAIRKGVPLRIEIGGKEAEAEEACIVRRDLGKSSKEMIGFSSAADRCHVLLKEIHDGMLARSRAFRDDNTHEVQSVSDIDDHFSAGKTGFVKAPVSVLQDEALDDVKQKYSLSARNMPLSDNGETVLVAKAY